MKNKKKNVLKLSMIAAAVLLWLFIWDIIAYVINNPAFFVGVRETFSAFFELVGTSSFWSVIFGSMKRILLGFAFGVILGTVLAVLSHHFYPIKVFVSLGMGVVKATPVASVIMIIWIFLKSSSVPSAIAVLMVAPIIWQNLSDGYESVDKGLSEVADVFELSHIKRFRYLVFPTLTRFFVPAVLTSVSLAWKAGIAAEIIAGTKESIGIYIKNSKNIFESDVMLAWTVAVVIISITFETLIKFLIRRYKARGT